MEELKDSFVIYKSMWLACNALPNETERVKTLDLIVKYGFGLISAEEAVEMASPSAVPIMYLIVPLIDASKKRYETNKANGAKGGRPKKVKIDATINQEE